MEKIKIITTLIAGLYFTTGEAQSLPAVPRLVVNITIDQLRTDYMEAFSPLYGSGGFKKLFENSRVYTQAQYPSSRLDRASAVATVSTGATPYDNGIVGIQWLDRETLRPVMAVDDNDCEGVMTLDKYSPRRLAVSTIGDELKVATSGKSIVYAIAPFGEEALFGAGHAADGAFWIDNLTGQWCSSSYYSTELPAWVRSFNSGNSLSTKLKNYSWTPSSDIVGNFNYFLSGAVSKPFSHKFEGTSRYRQFKECGAINDEITNAVLACLNGTQIGADEITDYLSITLHAGNYKNLSGPESPMELQDTYVRIDNALSKVISAVEKKTGANNTLFVITSTGYTNSAAQNLDKYRIPSGTFNISRTSALLNMYLVALFGQGQYVEACHGAEIYLNHKLIEEKQLSLSQILQHCEGFLIDISGIKDVYTSTRLQLGAWTPGISKIRNGYNPKCSGDILLEIAPGWNLINDNTKEVSYCSEAYVNFPIFLYGYNIKAEKITTPVSVERIAPTLSSCMRIRAPNACSAAPLEGVK